MPTYDYHCAACDETTEHFHGITEDPQLACEACGGELKRKISGGSGVIFKGTGFYQTDYKGAKKGAPQPAQKAPAVAPSPPAKVDNSPPV